MLRKIFLKYLIRWYVGRLDDIIKMDETEEMKAYRFSGQESTYKVLKSVLTAQVLWHFEAKSEDEKLITKGSALVLKIILDAHRAAEVAAKTKDEQEALKIWRTYKNKSRIN
jgi:hypothetical protein